MGKGDSVVLRQRVDPKKLTQAKRFRRVMTPAENSLWTALRRNHIDGFHFRRQQVIAGFIVDFYCHRARLVVEVDGDVHAETKEYDRERDRELERYQLLIVRITNEEVLRNLSGVVATIRALCNERARHPRSESVPPSQQGRGTGG